MNPAVHRRSSLGAMSGLPIHFLVAILILGADANHQCRLQG
jgi:hypothetical protein